MRSVRPPSDECTFAKQPFGLLDDATDAELVQAAWTDWAFRMPSIELLDTVAAAGDRAFGYEFAWPSPLPWLGATHALEIPFVNDLLGPFAAAMSPAPRTRMVFDTTCEARGEWAADAPFLHAPRGD